MNYKKYLSGVLAAAMVLNTGAVSVLAAGTDTSVQEASQTQTSSTPETVYVNSYDGKERSVSFNDHWRFYLGELNGAEAVSYNDSSWDDVTLPHDYSIDQGFSTAAPAEQERVVTLPEELEAPITAGQKLGTLELKKGDISYATVDLLASSAVEADRFMTFRHNTVLFFQKPAVKIIAIVLAVLLVVLLLLRLTGLSRRRRYGRSARGYSSGYRGRRRR